MNTGIGAKGGKKDRKLSFLNRIRKRNLEMKKDFQIEEKKKIEKLKQKQEEIIFNTSKEKNIPIDVTPSKKRLENNILLTNKQKKQNPKKETKLKIPISKKEKQILPRKIKAKSKEKDNLVTLKPKKNMNSNPIDMEAFLEKQVTKILEQDIQDKKFQLKKIDSEIYAIQKSIESTQDQEDLTALEKEIERLMDILEQIKRQILSLEKTFDLNFPVDEPDHYLIYLLEEYKNYRKDEKELSKKLEQNKDFKSLIDRLIEVEEKQEEIYEKMLNKRQQLALEEEQVQKLNDEIIDMEEIHQNMEKMIENHEKVLEQIKSKVAETVHITEKMEVITRSVDHTILDLFLLMSLLKHNLSIKNNAIAATTAAMALDMIIKITTPIQEKVVVKKCDIKNYEMMIHKSMDDTKFLEEMIDNNLNQLGTIRYTFEKEYGACSYLTSYQNAIKKLASLEEDMKDRKEDVIRMKKEMEFQLEKNNAKVKKYDTIKAA